MYRRKMKKDDQKRMSYTLIFAKLILEGIELDTEEFFARAKELAMTQEYLNESFSELELETYLCDMRDCFPKG